MRHLYGMAVLTGLLLVGCADTRQEAGEASREVGAAANRDRQEYQQRMENRLDQMDRQIEEMKEKSRNATGEAKAKWDREVAQLEDERREARTKYNNLKSATEAQWENMKSEVDQAMDSLERGYNRTLEAMKTDRK
jgi:predicted RNase H-like nuclease (RuvC/YqgF family)